MANLRLGNRGLQVGSTVRISDTGAITGTTGTFTDKVTTPASTTARAGLIVPHGTAPNAPQDGDIWSTITGLWVRIANVTRAIVTGIGVTQIHALTQSQWDDLPVKDDQTLYIVTED